MGAKKHIHKYHKVQIDSGKVWACADCNHFMPVHLSNLIPGRHSVCWGCGDIFRLAPINMESNQPQCDDCLGNIEEAVPLSLADKIRLGKL